MSDDCTCPIRPGMTYVELMEEIYLPELYCTSSKMKKHSGGYICPNLAKTMEKASLDKKYKERRTKTLVKQGLSPKEAEKKVSKRKFPKQKHVERTGNLEDLL